MIKLTLAEVVEAMAGRPLGEPSTVSVSRVSTDSRTVAAGDLFFALRGPNFDGHGFVADALRRGAVAAVVEAAQVRTVVQAVNAANVPLPSTAVLIEVDDTLGALGRLAAYHRRQMAGDVIAVVGSNGKTTTKAMIHHILAGRLRGRCSPKSFNNAVGVPLTLLSAEPGDEYLVVEIGTNAHGEVAALAEITQPDMAVLTSIGEEHLEGLGDVDGVAAEECSILGKLRGKGFAAVNIDTPEIQDHLPECGPPRATYGWNPQADVRLTGARHQGGWLHFQINERFPFRLRLVGRHNALNAAGAVTIARRFGLDYGAAAVRLESFVPPPMRNEVLEIAGVTIVNDAYNANPQSAAAAIETLEQMPCPGRRIAVFGEMRELGRHSAELHRKVAGRLLAGSIAHVILVGDATDPMYAALKDGVLFGPTVERCPTVDDCVERLAAVVQCGDVVLLKASRAVELDRVVDPLKVRLTTPAA